MTLEERFVRWQGQTITQLTGAITLFVSLSVGELAFVLSYLKEVSFKPTGASAMFYLASVLLLAISVACGVGAVITRLLDFRGTAQKVRLRQLDSTFEQIGAIGDHTKGLGKATWRLFWGLIGAFAFGTLSFTACLGRTYASGLLSAAGL